MRYPVLLVLCACGGPDKSAEQPHPLETTASASASAEPPPIPSSDTQRGLDAMDHNDLATAKSAFEAAIAKRPRDADAHHYLAVVLDKSNDKAGAEREYKAALAIKPDLAEAAANLGAIYVEGQRWDEAIALLKPEAQKRNDSGPVQQNLALALAGKGDQQGSARAFDAAVRITPTDPMLLYTYGHTLAGWNQNDAAVAKLKAARDAGANAELLGSIGHDLLLLRAIPDCIATFDKLIPTRDNAQYRTDRALCKLAGKDDPGATADLEAAVKGDDKYALAHFWLATRRMNAHRWADAAKELDSYLKLDPSGPHAKSAREALAIAKKGGKRK